MVMLPQTGLSVASGVAEKLRGMIAAHHFDQVRTVTASFGVAELAPDDDARSITRRVDEALYRAKGGGRNRVDVNGEEPVNRV